MSDSRYREEYIRRIHQVQDYMEQHIGQNLSLDELAEIAGFSKFHFSRIFQSIVQEPLAHYVNRIRMEQALFLLAHRMDKNMTDIALEMGFTDSAVFSRAFKNYYGVSPREYRQEYQRNFSDDFLLSDYKKNQSEKKDKDIVTGKITLELLNAKTLVYVRHIGTYESLEKEYLNLMTQLFTKADKQKLLEPGKNDVLAIYHDNPEFGEENQFRTSLCLTVPENKVIHEDEVLGTMVLEGGEYAVGHFRIRPDQYGGAWNYMYQEWLTHSGYVPRNASPFELYRNNPQEDAEHISEVDIYVPVEPLKL